MSQNSRVESEVTEVKSDVEQAKKVDVDSSMPDEESKINNDEGETKEPAHEAQIHQLPMAFSVITAPLVCPPGYRMDATGKCRRIM